MFGFYGIQNRHLFSFVLLWRCRCPTSCWNNGNWLLLFCTRSACDTCHFCRNYANWKAHELWVCSIQTCLAFTPTYPPTYPLTHPPTYLLTYRPTYLSIYLSIHPSIYLSIYLSLLYLYPSRIHPFLHTQINKYLSDYMEFSTCSYILIASAPLAPWFCMSLPRLNSQCAAGSPANGTSWANAGSCKLVFGAMSHKHNSPQLLQQEPHQTTHRCRLKIFHDVSGVATDHPRRLLFQRCNCAWKSARQETNSAYPIHEPILRGCQRQNMSQRDLCRHMCLNRQTICIKIYIMHSIRCPHRFFVCI